MNSTLLKLLELAAGLVVGGCALSGCCLCVQPTHALNWQRTEQLTPVTEAPATVTPATQPSCDL